MGKATSLTVDALLSMVNASVTGASVNASGDLVLTTRGGDSFNAGHVKGDTVSKILDMKPVTDAPSTYPAGFTVMSKPSGTTFGTWPADLLTIETIKYAASRTIQRISEKTSGRSWSRTETDNDAWTTWIEWADLSKVAPLVHTHAATDISSGLLANARLNTDVSRGLGQITSVVDWNTLTNAGSYDVNTIGANGPTAYSWGVLVIQVANYGGTVAQIYYPHGSPRSVFQRVRYGATAWSVWSELHNWADTQTDISGHFADSAGTNYLPSRLQPTAQDITGGNLLSYKQTGFYKGNNVTNAPVVGTGSWWYFEVIRHDDTYVNYMAYEYFGKRVYRGFINNGVWQGWTSIVDAYGDTGWVDLSTTIALKTGITFSRDGGAWGGIKARRSGGNVQFIVANVVIAANYFKAPGGTGTNPTLPADGNINNVLLFDGIPLQYCPGPNGIGALATGSAGNSNAMYVQENGSCFLSWFEGAASVTTAQSVSGAGMFIV